ncbi:MAG: hypothetical protein DI536_02605 [Archangium gephyra]|uniref:DUF2058 domain-containing protein n=1 Tax=Archangium gephyra TaxID=48 RepID=A0A2W5U5A3_9BACT|nr:MAG: hypothetical protein DI536_02605 [Archangium gephyra]
MQSLRDKLMKAGLVTEEAAKKAEADKAARPPPQAPRPPRSDAGPRRDDNRPPRRDDNRPPPRRDDRPPQRPSQRRDEPIAARVPKLPPMAGSKEANRQASRKQLEMDKQLRELVIANTVPTDVGATPFYFVTRKNKLRRLELTEAQAKQLESGELAVVERPDPDKIEHALVPAAIAEQVKAISERAVRFLNKEGAKVGFLSDDEINARAKEADEPATPDAPAADEPKAEDTFITIKRAPLP